MLNKSVNNMFADRRKKDIPSQIPKQGCRRTGRSLHNDGHAICHQLWYLRTNYVDEGHELQQ